LRPPDVAFQLRLSAWVELFHLLRTIKFEHVRSIAPI
jgi:hypothetical protein